MKVLGVHPVEGHDIPGVRSIRQLEQTALFFPKEYDGLVDVPNEEAFELCRRLNQEESIIAGPSSGMALAGALKLVPDEPGVVVRRDLPRQRLQVRLVDLPAFSGDVPAAPDGGTAAAAAPSRADQLMDEMIENLKNPFDSVSVADLARDLDGGAAAKPLVVDVRPAPAVRRPAYPGRGQPAPGRAFAAQGRVAARPRHADRHGLRHRQILQAHHPFPEIARLPERAQPEGRHQRMGAKEAAG